MGRLKKEFTFDFKIEFIPISEDELPSWNAGLAFLLDLLREERLIRIQEQKALEDAAKAQKTTDTGSKYAWFVGHDGSARRGSIGSDARL